MKRPYAQGFGILIQNSGPITSPLEFSYCLVTRDKSALGILLRRRLYCKCRREVALLVSGAVIRGGARPEPDFAIYPSDISSPVRVCTETTRPLVGKLVSFATLRETVYPSFERGGGTGTWYVCLL